LAPKPVGLVHVPEELNVCASADLPPEVIVVQVGALPEPPDVRTCPDVPAAPAIVSAVVKFPDAITGAVSVLLVSVSVLVAVTILVGVIIPDRVVISCS
jgi:hypothetical protein